MTTHQETHTRRPAFWLRAIDHRKHQLMREYRETISDSARDGVSDEDYATTMATLEKMARNLGWSDDDEHEHPFPRRGRGRGPGRGAGHPAMMHGFGPRHPDGMNQKTEPEA